MSFISLSVSPQNKSFMFPSLTSSGLRILIIYLLVNGLQIPMLKSFVITAS